MTDAYGTVTDDIARLRELIVASERIVFFGGAGVSTESGIPDFRSVDGLYSQRYDYPPETVLSRSFFDCKPGEFYRFYREKMIFDPDAVMPNAAHLALARLERMGKMEGTGVITQNIDGLHTAAGSKQVFELHGSIHRNRCMRCGRRYPLDAVAKGWSDPRDIPRCACGGMLKPEVVLYEEPLDDAVVDGAIRAMEAAELLIIGGTSMTVYPAAGLVRYFRGDRIVVINRDAIDVNAGSALRGSRGTTAALTVIREPIGQVLGAAVPDIM